MRQVTVNTLKLVAIVTAVMTTIILSSCSVAKISYSLPDGYNRNDVYYPDGEESL